MTLSHLFSDHAVLLRSTRVPIWGKAKAGETIQITIGCTAGVATTNDKGHWKVWLDLTAHSEGPHCLIANGSERIVVHDVMIGEVWLAAGQSNMAWPLAMTTGAEKEIAASDDRKLRQFLVKKSASLGPTDDVEGAWQVAAPETSGTFSGTAYYFAKELRRRLCVPVGFINSSWGGTPIEAWMSLDALAYDDEVISTTRALHAEDTDFARRLEDFRRTFHMAFGRREQTNPDPVSRLTEDKWKPCTFSAGKRDNLPTVERIWFRKKVSIGAPAAGLWQPLEIGPIEGFYWVYLNNALVVEVSPETGGLPQGPIYVSDALVQEGDAEFVICIYNPGVARAIESQPLLRFAGQPLDGPWHYWSAGSDTEGNTVTLDRCGPLPRQPIPRQTIGATLFHGMIAPLIPCAICGIIWYQGESNTPRASRYGKDFSRLIEDWRKKWALPQLPFYYCQLANTGDKPTQPEDHSWAELREAQSRPLEIPFTGQAVLIDAGEAGDVHARNKRIPGQRLAKLALRHTYGHAIVASGPCFRGIR